MSENHRSRRGFMKTCGAAFAVLAGTTHARPSLAGPRESFGLVELVDADGTSLTCDALSRGQELVFHYPYESTPCFLIKLEKPAAGPVKLETEDGERYEWSGGVGPDHSVVAFCAICAHRLTHPTRQVSFIGYRDKLTGETASRIDPAPPGGVIQCCSEQSVYDPANGARVLSGPAPQPLAAVDLRLADDGRLLAHGVYGGTLFERFFDEFGFRLAIEFGEDRVRKEVSGSAMALPIEQYTSNRISC